MNITVYTVEIQVSGEDGRIWQAMHPAETVTAFNGETAAQIAHFAACNTDMVDGTNWRVAVWHGRNADTSTEPARVLDGSDLKLEGDGREQPTYDLYAFGAIAELALPVDLEERLRDALDGDRRVEVRTAIEDRVNAKLREHGVTDDGEWLGQWSAQDIVRDVLAGTDA